MCEPVLGWSNGFARIRQAARIRPLKDVLFALGQSREGLFRDPEVVGKDVGRRVRKVVGEQKSVVLGKVAVVEDEEELDALLAKP